jgi:hypothetical protein
LYAAQLAHAPGRQPGGQIPELQVERRGCIRQVEEDVPVPLGTADRRKAVRGPLETLDFVHHRRREQSAVQAVGPRVIRALDRSGQPTLCLRAERGAAMPAHVVERAQSAGPVAHDQHIGVHQLPAHEGPGLGQFLGPAGGHPHSGEDRLHLGSEPLGIRVDARRLCLADSRCHDAPQITAVPHRLGRATAGNPDLRHVATRLASDETGGFFRRNRFHPDE